MDATQRKLVELVSFHCRAAKQQTKVPGLTLFRCEQPTAPVRSLYDPRVCIVLQGRKEITMNRSRIEIGPGEYLVVVLDLPVSARVSEATSSKPHLALTVDLDMQALAELALRSADRRADREAVGAKVAQASADMLEPFERLVRLLDTPADIETIAPLIMRELHYRLLAGELGDLLRQFGTTGSPLSRIANATAWIKENFEKPFSVADLAARAGMSVTTFHRAFKAATAMSPLQFRTRLRLHEARRRLLLGEPNIGSISFAIGYQSQSQFNREYHRMFGVPPGVDRGR